MAEAIGVIVKSKDADGVEYNAKLSLQFLNSKVKWKARAFDAGSLKKIQDFIDKDKAKIKNNMLPQTLDYCVSLDNGILKYFARYGTNRVTNFSEALSSIKPHEKRLDILDGLKGYGVTTDSFINAYKERDPMD